MKWKNHGNHKNFPIHCKFTSYLLIKIEHTVFLNFATLHVYSFYLHGEPFIATIFYYIKKTPSI